MTIRAAADGSALGNPGPAGWAWYVDDTCWAAGGWKHATNNQGELMAVLQFFRATAHLSDDLLILCDSQYVINCVTKWMPGWKKKGWRKADGKPVMNVELLKEIDAAIVGRVYRFEWVKGHANHPLNEAADARARAVSEAFQRGAAIPTGPGFVRAGDAARATTDVPAVAWKPESEGGVGAGAGTASVAFRDGGAATSASGNSNSNSNSNRSDAGTGTGTGTDGAPTLFGFDDDEPGDGGTAGAAGRAAGTAAGAVAPTVLVPVTVQLTQQQHERLRQSAARAGISVEQALAKLV